jgi:hypothetical protein
VFLVNSRLGHFTAAPFSFTRRGFTYLGHPFSLSYGANLPNSLTRAHSSTLGFSPHLPVSVCGTDTSMTSYEAFLGSMGSTSLLPFGIPIASQFNTLTDFPIRAPYRLGPDTNSRMVYPSASPLRYGVIQVVSEF